MATVLDDFKQTLTRFVARKASVAELQSTIAMLPALEDDDLERVQSAIHRLSSCGRLEAATARELLELATAGSTRLQAPRTGGVAPEADGPTTEVEVGTTLGKRYVIERLLGRGGMGVVYRARDLVEEEAQARDPYVAIKVLNDALRQLPDALLALNREASKTKALAHPNVVNVYNFDRDGDAYFIVMELLDGSDLEDVLDSHPQGLPFETAMRYTAQLTTGLAFAHSQNIVHADFKPGNVFVTRDGNLKIYDFGLARATRRTATNLHTPTTTVFDPGVLEAFTPAYASLEIIDGLPPVPSDDVYALACVVYRLFSGRHPFAHRPANQARRENRRAAPIAGLTRRQRRALDRALAFDRADRTPSVDAFAEAFLAQGAAGRRAPVVAAGAVAVLALGAVAYVLTRPISVEPPSVQTALPAPAQRQPEAMAPLAKAPEAIVESPAPPEPAPSPTAVPEPADTATAEPVTAAERKPELESVPTEKAAIAAETEAPQPEPAAAPEDPPVVRPTETATHTAEAAEPAAAAAIDYDEPTAADLDIDNPAPALIERPPPVPAGMVAVRLPDSRPQSRPQSRKDAAYLAVDRTEVSVVAYQACVDAGACRKTLKLSGCNLRQRGREQHPLNCASVEHADAYCRWRGARLPTGDEWYAAAGGTVG
ncbi:MAG: protein kinase, partial [Pseudomonadota bacterium]